MNPSLLFEIGRALGARAYRAARVLLQLSDDDGDTADDADERRRRTMRKSAEARRCPACGRAGALRDVAHNGRIVLRCRWCGHTPGEPKP